MDLSGNIDLTDPSVKQLIRTDEQFAYCGTKGYGFYNVRGIWEANLDSHGFVANIQKKDNWSENPLTSAQNVLEIS